ncbi:hypothetical protein MKZ38_003410 [Zalerion maritima]|uniref:WHIM1 domain-containing protein n=1 Tax=Zalerion maritima TaxID=339359 RepID=A0AAD5WQP0_9PEZI|nr:hypothetical protein MKZ38_003410 [Zalerion maritima]
MDDDSSDLSSLSSLSPVPSDEEPDVEVERQPGGILKFFHPVKTEEDETTTPKIKVKKSTQSTLPSPPEQTRRERVASPPREPIFTDNPDIAFIAMFRSRFNDAFPKSLQNFGPQELEKDVTEEIPGTRVENFLCVILGLLLNRKQDVKPGHYNRALEDAISSNKTQWPRAWEGKNPIAGQATFTSLTPTERLTLLRTLILWALASSDAVRQILNTSYKQNRHNDDLNQPLSVQPWGTDSFRRRYYLIEGLDDTAFRVYREGNPANLKEREWVSVAGSLPELRELSDKLDNIDGGPKAKRLSIQMMQAVPRFEATEEKDRFKRPEPGFSLYEGRTRGKRIRYTYSDDEEEFESESTNRRSARYTGANTPVDTGPTITASGRQVRRPGGMNNNSSRAASVFSDQTQDTDVREFSVGPNGRQMRPAASGTYGANSWGDSGNLKTRGGHYSEADFGDDEEDEGDEDAEEADYGDDHVPGESDEDEDDFDEDEAMVDDDLDEQPHQKKSLVVKLPIPIRGAPPRNRSDVKMAEAPAVAAEAAAPLLSPPARSPAPAPTPATTPAVASTVDAET